MYKITVTPELILDIFTEGNRWESTIICKTGIKKESKLVRVEYSMIDITTDFKPNNVELYFLEPGECLEYPYTLKEILPHYEFIRE